MGGLSACQHTKEPTSIDQQQVIVKPNVVVDLDSDGGGVTDDLDQCPTTPEKVDTDKDGCPIISEMMQPSGMELRFFYQNQSLKYRDDIALVEQHLEQIVTKMPKFPEALIYNFGHVSAVETENKANANPTMTKPPSVLARRY